MRPQDRPGRSAPQRQTATPPLTRFVRTLTATLRARHGGEDALMALAEREAALERAGDREGLLASSWPNRPNSSLTASTRSSTPPLDRSTHPTCRWPPGASA